MKMHITQLIIVFLLVFVSSCSVNGLAVEEIDIEFTIPNGNHPLIGKAIKISRTSDPLYNDITMNGTIEEGLNTLEYSGSADSPIAGYSESKTLQYCCLHLKFMMTPQKLFQKTCL